MDLDLWGSNLTTSSRHRGFLHTGVETKSQDFPEFSSELQRVVYHSVKGGWLVDGKNRWPSLATPPGFDVLTNVLPSPQMTLEWWQIWEDPQFLQQGKPNPMSPLAVCEALWEGQAFHVKHISPTGGLASESDDIKEFDAQVYEYTAMPSINSPVPSKRLLHDLPHCSRLQPSFEQSQDQIVCDLAEDPSWPTGRCCFDAEALPTVGHGCSRSSPRAPNDNSTNQGPMNYCVQQTYVHHNTAFMEQCLTDTTSPGTYPTSPSSTTLSYGAMEGNHEPCGDSACGTSESRRRAKDAFLIQSKRSGMSYREIRTKGHFKEAESTLRGRYRTLTKCREHRVRKPQWHPKDVSPQLVVSFMQSWEP